MTMALTQVSDNGLTNTGVTAATYGSSSAIPSLTIDAKGRVTAASTTSIDSTSIANGTSNVTVAANSNIDFVRAGNTEAIVVDGGIKFTDNKKALFGSSSDLQIFHDGSNSYIDDAGTGNLKLNSNEVHILSNDNAEYSGRFISNGAAELYYDGSKKLETKSDGVDITGELQCDSLDVDGAADINGQLSVNRVLVRDDGATSPIFNIRTDDDAPWALTVGNDTYSTSHEHGLRIYQGTDGSVNIRNSGNNAWEHINFQQQVGGTTETNLQLDANRSVNLRYQNSIKLSTASWGVNVQGELECDSLDVDGAGDFTGGVNFRGGAGAVDVKAGSDIRLENGGWTGDSAGKIQHHGDWLYVQGGSNGIIFRHSSGSNRVRLDSSGHLRPDSNNAYDLGRSDYRWRNVYTNDLNLSNEGSANDVDGTWGNFTIQEGENDLFLINRRSGKKYKFNLTEVN
tara:strand:- start:1089 stop:2453 length:1365 start_codon:yes stop_codon:yes gene_type:complete